MPLPDVAGAQSGLHSLRRTYKTIATDHCGVADDISATPLGHVPQGMSQRYLLKWARTSDPAIIEAQHKISAKMVALLHGKTLRPREMGGLVAFAFLLLLS